MNRAWRPAISSTTIELKINYLRPLTLETGKVRAVATVVHIGRTTALAEGRVLDAADAIYAYASSTCLIRRYWQPLQEALFDLARRDSRNGGRTRFEVCGVFIDREARAIGRQLEQDASWPWKYTDLNQNRSITGVALAPVFSAASRTVN